jgi:DNA polymerase I-like protein with 3'-5' exonuclease and polymerase domains
VPPKAKWEPPPDPDFEQLATKGFELWQTDKPEDVAFDTETTGLAYFDEAFCVTCAWYRPDGSITGHYFELPSLLGTFETKYDSSEMVREILNNTVRLIGHNTKFDLQKTILAGVLDPAKVMHVHDTQILAHLVNEHRPLGLKELMVSVLGWDDTIEVPYKSGEKAKLGLTHTVVREKYLIQEARTKMKLKKEDGYHLLPRGIVVPYAITDAEGTLQLYTHQRPLVQRHPDNWSCYVDEMELTFVLLDMEDAGLGVVKEYVDAKVKEYQKRVLKLDIEIQGIVQMPVGKDVEAGEFNPGSPAQLKEMFVKLGFNTDSTNKDALEKIDHPLAKVLLQRRSDEKMLSTYLRAIQNEQRDNILHPSFRQNVSTGRMASGKAKED